MVQDTNGKFNSYKKNCKIAYLIFKDTHAVKLHICENCLIKPNFERLIQSILHEKSNAFRGKDKKIRELSKSYLVKTYEREGAPISLTDVTPDHIRGNLSNSMSKAQFQTMENANQVFQG